MLRRARRVSTLSMILTTSLACGGPNFLKISPASDGGSDGWNEDYAPIICTLCNTGGITEAGDVRDKGDVTVVQDSGDATLDAKDAWVQGSTDSGTDALTPDATGDVSTVDRPRRARSRRRPDR